MLADRNMRVLFIGQSMNMLGNYAMLVVLGIWVKTLTGSSADAGLIFLLLGATSFLAPLTGLLVDRFPRRLVLIGNDAVTAAVMTLLAASCTTGARSGSSTWLPASTGLPARSTGPRGAGWCTRWCPTNCSVTPTAC